MPKRIRKNCNLPEQMFLCEAASFYVDSMLQLGVVPMTGIVRLPVITVENIQSNKNQIT